jgi:hypothetical protein
MPSSGCSRHGASLFPEPVRARIFGCSDLALLDRWLARAVTSSSAADVVDA